MNGEDSTLEDEYVQEFVLDQFENGPIKQEVGTIGVPSNNNNNEEEINQNSIQNIPHHYQRLPSIIPPPMMINSPPHHLLTPPENLNDNYHQHHRQVVLKASNLILYPNIPGTPPDTPPVSNSPSPQTNYLDQNYHPHIQQMPKGMGYNDMIWPPADRRNRQEPLDLRPTCNDNVSELQNWNVMQQSTSVIASNGKRIVHQHTDYTQLIQNQSSNSPYCKPLCNGGLISPASTSSRTNSLNGRNLSRNSLSTSISCGTDIDDDTLVNLSVRDLNMRLKSLPREEVVKLKLKRRTLKNRGYAQNCRSKRVMQKNELETKNRTLHDEINKLKMKYHEVVQERDLYKRRWEILASENPSHPRRGAMHSDVYL